MAIREGAFSVALVGADGAGKTTVARHLADTLPFRTRYVYMGTSIGSSNVTLPTSRLLLFLKQRAYEKSRRSGQASFSEFLDEKSARRGPLYVTLRLANRLLEEWYRQFVAWRLQRQGNVVLFDRHYLYEFAAQRFEMAAGDTVGNENARLSERIHVWLLERLYPRPDMVLFLDAEPEVMFARKGEWSVEHLRKHQRAVAALGREAGHFVRIDAAQPLEAVQSAASEAVRRFHASRNRAA